MVVKSGGKNQLVLEGTDPQSTTQITANNGNFEVSVKYNGQSQEIVKPGEYEVAGVEIFGKELRDEKNGSINSLFFTVDGVTCLLSNILDENIFEWLKGLPFVDILIVTDASNLKEAISKVDPYKVIIGLGSDAKEEDLKKYTSLPITKAKQFKFKDTDFDQEEENTILEVSILE